MISDEQRQEYYDRKVAKHTATAMLFLKVCFVIAILGLTAWLIRAII